MESADSLKKSERQKNLEHWLAACVPHSTLVAMPGDASFRRYFRVSTDQGSWVAMDAPPPRENCRPYVAIAHALRAIGLQAPDIIQADVERGFLLLTDFGDMTYLKALNNKNADLLYSRALDALTVLQGCRSVPHHTLPLFTKAFMQDEWAWHKEWFLNKLLGLSFASEEAELDKAFNDIAESAASQPQVFMHRDYHSANLMMTPEGEVGILDFQDAFIGPLTYDVVSLLRDCYIDWPETRVTAWALQYKERLEAAGAIKGIDEASFLRWFDWMGVERHLKALFTFARKHVRDQQSEYLRHIPRTLMYVHNVTRRYPELVTLHDYMTHVVVPAWERKFQCAP